MQRAQEREPTQKKNNQPIQMSSNSMVAEEAATRYNLRESKRTNEESTSHPPPAKRVKTLTVARVEPIPKFMPTSRNSLILGQIVQLGLDISLNCVHPVLELGFSEKTHMGLYRIRD